MTAIVTRGNAADLHLPDETVDLIVTSPPYFGLRSYQDGGEHYEGQVGDEATPTEYLDALIACTAEWIRVLKPGGSVFVNLGDKYAGSAAGGTQNGACGKRGTDGNRKRGNVRTAPGRMPVTDVLPKSLIGLPWRYAIRCIDDLGLILRAEVVWSKPNGLPESVTDRVRRSHEQVFHFVKQPRYFSAVDEVREAHAYPLHKPQNRNGAARAIGPMDRGGSSQWEEASQSKLWGNPLGKLPGSVWTIPTAPLKVPASLGIDHFAAYPPELVRRIVLGWSPREVCTACGEGRAPQVLSERHRNGVPVVGALYGKSGRFDTATGRGHTERADRTITGYVCDCPDTTAPATPGLVLDPFGGTGTTALVASCYGRVGISVDLSADYCRLARWRTTDPGERARVLGVDKPPQQVTGQIDLFGEWTA